MNFHIGQRVVCVNAARGFCKVPWRLIGGMDGLTEKQVYTVRKIGVEPLTGSLCLWLYEIVRPIWGGDPGEAGFHAGRFRPVVERKTDISALAALLNPANHKYLERAE